MSAPNDTGVNMLLGHDQTVPGGLSHSSEIDYLVPHSSIVTPGGLSRVVRAGRRTLRSGTRFHVLAGTNTLGECRIALASLLGLLPRTDGPDIPAYEACFAKAVGSTKAFSFASGRMALYAILEALGIGQGDEVILPAFTCVVVPNAVIYRGARPVFVDIDPETYNIDVNRIEAKVTRRTKAIIAQHTFGLVCEMGPIADIARRHRLAVIEDCAHALGAEYGGQKVGSMGRAGYFSTDHTKVISTGTGGMVTTSDAELADRVAHIQECSPFCHAQRVRSILCSFVAEWLLFHPRVCSLGRDIFRLVGPQLSRAYFMDELMLTKPSDYPYPARLSNAQATIGLSQLYLLQGNLAWRRGLARLYEEEIGALRDLVGEDYSNHACLRYTFMVQDRRAWIEHLESVLDMGVWFTSIAHGRNVGLHAIHYETGSCPMAERAARHCVNLPTHPHVIRPETLIRRVQTALRSGNARLSLLPTSNGQARCRVGRRVS